MVDDQDGKIPRAILVDKEPKTEEEIAAEKKAREEARKAKKERYRERKEKERAREAASS